ncbi:MAG: 50S ribosomal protein L11 methyltransferase [Aquificaceae bacterium]|nr:50S ribosomal protein L11 methyltransferase [Aquificaceae bacterium]
MYYTKYVYRLSVGDFYEFLAEYGKGLEILSENESSVEFATYEPVQGLKPLDLLKVEVLPPEKSFRPLRVKNFMILPSWIKPVVIRQGAAFGTGLHATTRLCLMLIEEFLQEDWSVLDVGSGTGILAIASKKLGAGKVVAIDVDPQAVEECKHNSQENCASIECLLAKPEDIGEEFDLLVANLELDIFRREIKHLKRLFKRVAIFSGLYRKEDLREFLKLLEAKPAKIKRLEGWYGVVIRR